MAVFHPVSRIGTAFAAFLGVIAAAAAWLAGPLPAHAAGSRRFALLVGNDLGAPDSRPLQYAARDARRIHDVLTELGNVRHDDARLVINGTAEAAMRALDELDRRAADARRGGDRVAIIVYYSGHAKDGLLQLGRTYLPLEHIKARLVAAHADVRIGIFDSCRSGVATRTKGVRKGPAFDVESATSEDARGVVFLSSSSADEDAQESDEIGGSYFSHHLETGLRGGADRSGDDRITLSEAYAYAYGATVADTADSAAGAQHPTFSYDLKGNADVVLTEISLRREGLHVPAAAPAGTYYVVRQGLIAAEVRKGGGEERRIALAPGRYFVKRRLPNRLRIGEIRIAAGQVVTLNEAGLRDAPFSDDPVKGVRRDAAGARVALALSGTAQSFFDKTTRQSLFPPSGLLGIELQVRDFFRRGWVVAIDVAAGGADAHVTRPYAVVPFKFGQLGLGASLFTEWSLLDGRLVPFAGARVVHLAMSRKFENDAIPNQTFSTFSPGLLGGLRYRFGNHLSLFAQLRVHYVNYNVEQGRSLGYSELALALAYDF